MTQDKNIDLAPDFMKAFGIALVVFGHVLRGLFASDIAEDDVIWGNVDRMIYVFHMPLFFYASGLFIKKSVEKYGYKSFLQKTAIVLLLPMIIWSYLQYTLQFAAGAAVNHQYDFLYVITAPFPPRQQFWFLGVLFVIAALGGLLFKYKKSNKFLVFVITLLFALQCLFWTQFELWMGQDPFLFLLIAILIFSPFFLLGSFLDTAKMREYKISTTTCLLIFAGALVCYQVIDIFSGFVHTVVGIVCVLSIYKISLNLTDNCDPQNKIMKMIVFVGMNSMIIYLAHVIGGAAFRILLIKIGIMDVAVHLVGGFLIGFLGPLFLIPIGLKWAKSQPRLAQAVFPVRNVRA